MNFGKESKSEKKLVGWGRGGRGGGGAENSHRVKDIERIS